MDSWFGVAVILNGLAWHIPALAFGGAANAPDIVIMGVGGLGFAVQEGMFKEWRIYSS